MSMRNRLAAVGVLGVGALNPELSNEITGPSRGERDEEGCLSFFSSAWLTHSCEWWQEELDDLRAVARASVSFAKANSFTNGSTSNRRTDCDRSRPLSWWLFIN